MVNDFLFELGTEELPSASVKVLGDALANQLIEGFASAHLTHGSVRQFATPRRIAVLILDLQTTQASQTILKRGPAHQAAIDKEGNPTPALQGFAKSCGVGVDQLTLSKSDKGEWWVYESHQPGQQTIDLLPAIVANAVNALPIVKPMRWGIGEVEFARPIHWALLLLGDQLVNTEILGVKTGRESFGHRYHHPQAITITSPKTYESLLKEAFVIADFDLRQQLIIDQMTQLSEDNHVVMPQDLLIEVTSIVEWPKALMINFDQKFLAVPAEALIAAMQSHQKCFAIRDQQGNLKPEFITISNINSQEPQQVILGNERVMRARLSDAAFFFEQDQKKALIDYEPALSRVIFQQKLGSLADKSNRLQAFMSYFSDILQLDLSHALRAARLSKCDLLTGMVGEFPELQGLMGYYYASLNDEPLPVAVALDEQYMPRFAADSLPKSSLGLALSLADRLDTLVGAFGLGQKPSGTKDPFKLRRHALAVVRLLVQMPISVRLSDLIAQMHHIYGTILPEGNASMTELKSFILERMQSFYLSQGVSADLVHAVRARQDECLFDLDQRIHAIKQFNQLPEAASLSSASKRVNNLLTHANQSFDQLTTNPNALIEPAEKVLFAAIHETEQRIASHYESGDYAYILSQLAGLHRPVEAFFEQVLVMTDDISLKNNRLLLLRQLQHLLQGVADISMIQTNS